MILPINNKCTTDCMKILSNNNHEKIKNEIESLKFDLLSLYPAFMSIQNSKDFDSFFKLLDKKMNKFADIMLKIKLYNKNNNKEYIKCIEKCDKEEIMRQKQTLKMAIVIQHLFNNKKMQKLVYRLYKKISDKKIIKKNLEVFDEL